MNIGIDFVTLENAANLLWCVNDFKLEQFEDTYVFTNGNDRFIFCKNRNQHPSDNIRNCDIKIRAFHTFEEWKTIKGYDLLIQSQLVENYHIENYQLKEFLDAGNISLSSASISFEHPNFHYEPFFNINYFYYFYGFNYLNYYKLKSNKINFIGAYHMSGGKLWRDDIFYNVKKIVDDDILSFSINDYNLKSLFEPYGPHTFGLWGLNHIASYTDYKTSVCNLLFETLDENPNNELDSQKMYGRRYITEKTLKAIAFGEEEIFFIWYGPQDIYEYLIKLGFWFYNSEFYNGDMKSSVYDAVKELKRLKENLQTNDAVYEYLKENYCHKLNNNVNLFKTMLLSYYKKNDVINLIKKNGKRN